MAILCETGKFICCALRPGVQVAVVILLVLNCMGIYDGIARIRRAFDGENEWDLKYRDYYTTCKQLVCAGGDPEGGGGKPLDGCFLLKLSGTDGGAVKSLHFPTIMEDEKDEFGEYDKTKWKLTEVTDYKSGNLVWPKGDTKDAASLDTIVAAAQEECSKAKDDGDQDKLKFVFDWSADPTNEARSADQKKWRAWWKFGAVCSMVQSVVDTALFVYLGYVVFGSNEGIAEKKEHMQRARTAILIAFFVFLLVDGVLVGYSMTSFLAGVILAIFLISKTIGFVVVVFIDNLNDVVQAGGFGTEGLPATQVNGKSMATPLLAEAVVVGEADKDPAP